ncbi:insulinase-like peptidase [Moraxella macacae 0408225]|uniref:Insulinase-like peptidase n=1 Tax=Moraxella macacae 0408225 TaxID=1230338 RepID=L2F697_9GAMM|nr:pitrilysin family protein [Moraxella macacae]ELA08440.1 insulinase-like peptidase [Moraxella macacae 0408225]
MEFSKKINNEFSKTFSNKTFSNTLPSLALSALCIGLSACAALTPSSKPMLTQHPIKQQSSNNQSPNPALESDLNSNLKSTQLLSNRHEYRLDNGLKVIIKEDHRSPIVMSQVWYNVGSDDEPEALGGISHLLEHMMFKGTKKVSSNDFEQLIAKFGGKNNAFTSHDYTAYYEIFPANRLNLALELEADRMTNLQLQQADFDSERLVVMEERRQRTDDNPQALAFEQFMQMVYPNSPKGESVIGPMAEIQAITLDDLKKWYQTWYAPNNATIVIVGDVKAKEALAQVKKYFGNKKPTQLPNRPSVQQKAFRGYQEATTKLSVQAPFVLMAYNLPTLTTAKDPNTAYTLALLNNVLDGGLSARLEKNLVRQRQILAAVASNYSAFHRGDGVLMIQATPRDGVSLEMAKQAIIDEIEALKTQTILDSELKRAKTTTMTGLIYSQDTLTGQAQMIGSLSSIGLDDRLIYQLPTIFDKINQQQIQQVAKQYLTKDNLTVLKVVKDSQ